MQYKILRGVPLDDDILNTLSAQGWSVYEFEQNKGMYDVILQSDNENPQDTQWLQDQNNE